MNPVVSQHAQLYLLLGNSFLREKKLGELIKTSGSEETAVHIYHSWDFDSSQFVREVQTFPIFSAKQFFVLKEADHLSKPDKEILIKSLTSIPFFSVIALEAEEIAKSDLLYGWVLERGCLFEFRDLNLDDLELFAKGFLKKEGRSIGEDALEILLERCRGNATVLQESLSKLALYATGKKRIEPEMVLALSERDASSDGFDLLNAFSRNELNRALKILADLCQLRGAEPAEILGLFNWHFKRLWQAHEMLAKGYSFQDIGRMLRIPRYFWDDFLRQAKRFTQDKLKVIFEALFELDWQIKRGMLEPKEGIETFLIRFGS